MITTITTILPFPTNQKVGILCQGLDFSTDLRGVRQRPLHREPLLRGRGSAEILSRASLGPALVVWCLGFMYNYNIIVYYSIL